MEQTKEQKRALLKARIILCCMVFFMWNLFFGNPISAAVARFNFERYADKHYEYCYVKNSGFNLGGIGYYATVHLNDGSDAQITVLNADVWGIYIYSHSKLEQDTNCEIRVYK